ncbi:MAG TPA: ABC transporter permease [Nitriliruptorales bacterium]
MIQALRDKLVDLWHARELLRQFVGKELKVRYKNSALGFLWSLLTPAAMTVVFTVVFAFVFRINVDDFAAFFLAGYLAWSFFNNSVTGSIQAVTGNGNLIKKVYFPREVLPLSIVIGQLVHLVLALLVMLPYFVWVRGVGVLTHLPALAVGVIVLFVFTSGVSMLLAGANVSFRDLQELIVVVFLVWFYATPVIYPVALVERQIADGVGIAVLFGHIISLNPMTWFVKMFREALYGEVAPRLAADGNLVDTMQSWPSPELLTVTVTIAFGAFVVGYLAFHRFALTFAKEV